MQVKNTGTTCTEYQQSTKYKNGKLSSFGARGRRTNCKLSNDQYHIAANIVENLLSILQLSNIVEHFSSILQLSNIASSTSADV